KEIGFGPRELEQPQGLELTRAEDLGIGDEADSCPSAVRRRAQALQPTGRISSGKLLREQFLVLRDFDSDMFRKRIDHADADAVKAPARGVGLAGEFPARVQRGENDFER